MVIGNVIIGNVIILSRIFEFVNIQNAALKPSLLTPPEVCDTMDMMWYRYHKLSLTGGNAC